MKKLNLLALCTILVASQSYAQYFTLKIGGGYAWAGLTSTNTLKGFQPYISDDISQASKVLDPAYANILDMANSTNHGYNDINNGNKYIDTSASKSIVHDSYGRGGNLSIAIGYRINPYISVDMGFNYLFGASTRSTQVHDDFGLLGAGTTIKQATWSAGASMMPSVTVYGAKPGWKVVPYVRAGLTLPIAGKTVHEIDVNSPNFLGAYLLTSSLRVETESQFSLGFNGAIGVQYTPVPLISIWAEINGNSLSVAAKTSTLTKYLVNSTRYSDNVSTSADRIAGTGNLPAALHAVSNDPLTQYSRVIEFVNEVTTSSNTEQFGKVRAGQTAGPTGTVNENANHQVARVFAPFTAFGFNVGISINMSKKIFQDPFGKKAKKKA